MTVIRSLANFFEFAFFGSGNVTGKILVEADDIGTAYRLACAFATKHVEHATSIGHGHGHYSLARNTSDDFAVDGNVVRGLTSSALQ